MNDDTERESSMRWLEATKGGSLMTAQSEPFIVYNYSYDTPLFAVGGAEATQKTRREFDNVHAALAYAETIGPAWRDGHNAGERGPGWATIDRKLTDILVCVTRP